jgi:hypothetical protein
MAKFTAAQIKEHAEKAMEAFEDGFQWSDLISLVPTVMEIVGEVKEMGNDEKRESAEAILDYVIDETDIPWLPDSLVDPVLKKGVRMLIPVLFDAAEGKFKFKPDEPQAGA